MRKLAQATPALFTAILLAATGCALKAPTPGAAAHFADVHVDETAKAGRMAVQVVQKLPPGYHVNYLQEVDWDSCTITLTNAAPSTNLSSGALTPSISNGVRSASFAFTPLTPATGYTVTVTLKRGATTIASGSLGSVTISAGPNSVNVPVTVTNQNVVTVEPTLTTTDNLTAQVQTNGYASIGTVGLPKFNGTTTGTGAGNYTEVSGIDTDTSGNVYVSDSKLGRIQSTTNAGGAANTTVVAGGGGLGFSADGAISGTTKLNTPRGLVHEPTAAGRLMFCEFGTTATDGRIRTIIGGNLGTYGGGGAGAAGTNAVDATTIAINGPSGICADSAANIFFTETGTGKVRFINTSRVINTLDTLAGSNVNNFGPICLDRTNNVLYYSQNNVIYSIATPAGTPGARKTVATLTSTQLGTLLNTPNTVTGLATDGNGLLYAAVGSKTANSFDSDVRIARIPVDTAGALITTAGRSIDVVAGTGAQVTAIGQNDVSAQVLDGTTQKLGGSMNNLAIDVHSSNSGVSMSGILYLGDCWTGPSSYAEVLQLFPPTGGAPTGFSKY